MPSQIDIWNMALGAIGAQGRITSANDRSREAETCQLYYEPTRNLAFAMLWWDSLRSVTRLARLRDGDENPVYNDCAFDDVYENDDPQAALSGYRFMYSLPADCARPRFLQNYERFEMVGKKLHTNSEAPILTYSKIVEDPNEWEFELTKLVAALLAAEIAMPITRSVQAARLAKQEVVEVYNSIAPAAMNRDTPTYSESIPPDLLARGGTILPDMRYSYPMEVCPYGAISPIQFHGGRVR